MTATTTKPFCQAREEKFSDLLREVLKSFSLPCEDGTRRLVFASEFTRCSRFANGQVSWMHEGGSVITLDTSRYILTFNRDASFDYLGA